MRTALLGLPLLVYVSLGCAGGASPAPPPGPVPVIINAGPTGSLGLPGTTATFAAQATESPKFWEWTFGDGALPVTSSDASPTVRLNRPGTSTGQVIAHNGNGASAPRGFEFAAQAPVLPPWSELIFAVNPESAVSTSVSAVAHGDRVLVFYTRTDAPGNRVMVSSPLGAGGSPVWGSYLLDLQSSAPVELISSGGAAVALTGYGPGGGARLFFLYTAEAIPDDPSDWTLCEYEDEAASISYAAAMPLGTGWMVVTGGPSVPPPGVGRLINAYITTNPLPSSLSDWTPHTITTGFGLEMSVASSGGLPVIQFIRAFSDSGPLRIAVSRTPTPTSAADWSLYDLGVNATSSDMLLFNDRLTIAYATWPYGENAAQVRLARATVPVPLSPSDWTETIAASLLEPTLGGQAHHVTAAEVNGRLVLGYRKLVPGIDPFLLRATAVEPQGPADWEGHYAIGPGTGSGDAAFAVGGINGRIFTLFDLDGFYFAQFADGPW